MNANQWDAIRQLDENDSPVELAAAIGELLDDNEQLRAACAKWQEVFCGFPHDTQQALRDMGQRVTAITAARDELADKLDYVLVRYPVEGVPERVGQLRAVGKESPSAPRVDDESRCAVCQWPLAETAEKGCVRGNCSMRPLPANYYAPERAERERKCRR